MLKALPKAIRSYKVPVIPTDKLSISHLPDCDNLDELNKFALTFDIKEAQSCDARKLSFGSKITNDFTIIELRERLYLEQRRWNHFCRPPDEEAMELKRQIIELLRKKLASSSRASV